MIEYVNNDLDLLLLVKLVGAVPKWISLFACLLAGISGESCRNEDKSKEIERELSAFRCLIFLS